MKYRDIALEYSLVQNREKIPFSLFLHREIGFDASLNPESQVYGLSQIAKQEIPETLKNILSLEYDLIDVLFSMETF